MVNLAYLTQKTDFLPKEDYICAIKTNFTNTRGNSSEPVSYPSIVGFSSSIIFLILVLFNSIIDVKINMLLTYEFLCLYEGGHSKNLS